MPYALAKKSNGRIMAIESTFDASTYFIGFSRHLALSMGVL